MVKNQQCDMCDNNIICYVATNDHDDETEGYCERCCICREEGCNHRIEFRVFWNSTSGSVVFTLHNDLCGNHAKEEFSVGNYTGCSFFDAPQHTKIPFVYI